ncbi:alpha/beta fold hydrolase [Kitasatospora sp. NPDC094011]|uniref:alpha/beta fold hydrolase n=1 Tax=Kitasatospora sp. NPDC094011 TaxID=3364090 RepID=UPI00380BCB3D
METLAEQVNAVIDDAGRGPVDLLGFSLGAVVATAAAGRRPDQVRRLIATAGWIGAEQDEYLRLSMATWLSLADDPTAFGRYATLTAFSRGFLNRIGREAVGSNTAYMQPTPGTLRHIALDLALDLTPYLPRVQALTLVIGCTQGERGAVVLGGLAAGEVGQQHGVAPGEGVRQVVPPAGAGAGAVHQGEGVGAVADDAVGDAGGADGEGGHGFPPGPGPWWVVVARVFRASVATRSKLHGADQSFNCTV